MNKNYLIDLGFDLNTIELIKENNSLPLYEALIFNEYECIKIISYLRKLGITCIKELLIYRIDLFISSYDEVLNLFKNVNQDIINSINKNYFLVDELILDE